MASLLKNQILKHLSKFSKNLSPDKINLSTLKGEGELCNLELDEQILTQLLELPTWLQITRATVNKVNIKIQWTKLKSQPIFLMLDKVIIETETCEEPRPPNDPAHLASYRSGGKYGFIDRVIDGIYVHVESVEVKLISKAFHASLQLLRLKVQSTTPTWQPSTDLRHTRLRDVDRDQIILFKEIEWQNVKIEANAHNLSANPDLLPTPLRLLANMSKIRITFKKKLSDCSIISSRIILLVDDLLWVLTSSQLKAAILYSNSLSEVVERSAQQSKQLAAEKLKQQGHLHSQSDHLLSRHAPPPVASVSSSTALFNKYDVTTTSYHLITSRIDLHLCDDGTADTVPPAERSCNLENGAMQLTMFKFSIDYYPFHLAGGERKLWFRYADNIGSRNPWVQQLFSTFRKDAMAARKACGVSSPATPHHQRSPQHQVSPQHQMSPPQQTRSPARSPQHMSTSSDPRQTSSSPSHVPMSHAGSPSHLSHAGSPSRVVRPSSTRLLESCVVVKLEDFTVYMVSSPHNQRTSHNKFLASDKKQLHLPSDMSVLHLEFTEYFFPTDFNSPVPHANLYALLNPVRLTFDRLTVLWLNFFLLDLSLSLKIDLESTKSAEHVDVKFEALMPRLLIPAETKVEGQPDRPEFLQIQISKVCISNTRVEEKLTCHDLKTVLKSYKGCQLLHATGQAKQPQFDRLPQVFYDHANKKDNCYLDKRAKWLIQQGVANDPDSPAPADESCLSTNTLKKEAALDMWGVVVDQVWLEFLGALNSRSRPQPFVEAVPLTLWLTAPQKYTSDKQTDHSHEVHDEDVKVHGEDVDVETKAEKPDCEEVDGAADQAGDDDQESSDKRPSRLVLKQTTFHETASANQNNCGNCDSRENTDGNSGQACSHGHAGEKLADVNVIGHLGAKLRVQMNHFQYLFVLRLAESMTKFADQLNSDYQLLGVKGSSSVSFPLVVPHIEVAAMCPCLMNLKCFPDDLSSPVSPRDIDNSPRDNAYSPKDNAYSPKHNAYSLNHEARCSPQQCSHAQFAEPGCSKQAEENDSRVVQPTEYLPNVVITKSCSDSKLCNNPAIHALDNADNQISSSSNTLSNGTTQAAEQEFRMSTNSVGMDSGISMDSRRSARDNKMKMFSTAFINWTDKLKVMTDGNEDNLSASTDDLETMSVKTDLSSDDDFEHLMFEDKEAPAFCHDVFETTSTTDTFSDLADDSSSVYAESSSTRGKEIVSVVLFKLDLLELLVESTGLATTVWAQVARVTSCQPGNINTEDFHAKFSNNKGYLPDDPLTRPVERFPIKFFYSTEIVEPPSTVKLYLKVSVSDVSLTFRMSSLTSLGEFLEDEKIPDPLPMVIDIRNLLLILEEDRPSASNPSSPGAMPIDIQVHRVTIRRGSDGMFHLSGGSVDSPIPTSSTAGSSGQNIPHLKTSDNRRIIELGQTRSDMDQGAAETEFPISQLVLEPLRQLQVDNGLLRTQVSELQQEHSKCDGQLESLRNENDRLKVKLELLRESKGANCTELQMENYRLQQRLAAMEEDQASSAQERKSLLATLKLLQDDLLSSEQRNRSHTSSS